MNFKFKIGDRVKNETNGVFKIETNGVFKIEVCYYDEINDINVYLCRDVVFNKLFLFRGDEIKNIRKELSVKHCPCCGNENLTYISACYDIKQIPKYYDEIHKDYTIFCDGFSGGCGLRMGFNQKNPQEIFEKWNNMKR